LNAAKLGTSAASSPFITKLVTPGNFLSGKKERGARGIEKKIG
jgi:hypothetical protein